MLVHKSSMIRFESKGNYDNKYIANIMKPLSMMKYLLPSFWFELNESNYDEVIKEMHDNSGYLCSVNTKNETNLWNMFISRGEIQQKHLFPYTGINF